MTPEQRLSFLPSHVNMTPEQRQWLKDQIKVKCVRDKNISGRKLKKWLREGCEAADLRILPSQKKAFGNFVDRNVRKFRETNSLARKPGSGRPRIPGAKQRRILELCINKKWAGTRRIAKLLGIGHNSVARYLKRAGCKSFARSRTQKMTPRHLEQRVECAKWALENYGDKVDGRTVWGRLINTDFSGPIGKSGKLNTKTDRIWSPSKESAGSLLDFPQLKYDENVMIWGGVSYKGLVPADSPIFASDLKAEVQAAGGQLGPRGGVNKEAYVHLIKTHAIPAVRALYGQRGVWQDDEARIHRAQVSIDACKEFRFRFPVEVQAPKMADVWPIERVWGILQQRVKEREPQTAAQNREFIVDEWRKLHRDKDLCKRLMRSIPRRLKAVIAVKGRQIRKSDYRNL